MMVLLSAWYVLPAAFALDLLVGDPPRLPHPIRWMGKAIETLESPFRRLPVPTVISGFAFAASLIFSTWVIVLMLLKAAGYVNPLARSIVEIVLVYYCLSASSLEKAAMDVRQSLAADRLPEAKQKVSMIVGRDVSRYCRDDVSRACVETVAENLVDGVMAPLFFAALGGAPLAMAYKMVNTLDSMVGYKNGRYILFGKAAARIDDVFNWVPARLSVPIIALAAHILGGCGRISLRTAIAEGSHHASPNAGYPEAAFAGALAVRLNGPNIYHGQLVIKPYIGVRFGSTALGHIKKACDLMMLAALIWMGGMWAVAELIR
jgi:adenosylcobinamide-phosphate synthase